MASSPLATTPAPISTIFESRDELIEYAKEYYYNYI
jgi:hypothetical protein